MKGGVNNSDTEAPLSGADGVIFNKARASEPEASGRRYRYTLASLIGVLLVLLLLSWLQKGPDPMLNICEPQAKSQQESEVILYASQCKNCGPSPKKHF